MRNKELREKVLSVFSDPHRPKFYVEVYASNNSIVINVESTTSFTLTYQHLLSLSKVFGTQEFDIDGISETGGCETCGYGARKGYTFKYKGEITNA